MKPEKHRGNIYLALADAQAKWSDPIRDTTGQVGMSKYKYATLEQVLALVREYLTIPHGVALSQSVDISPPHVPDMPSEHWVPFWHVHVMTSLAIGESIMHHDTRLPVYGIALAQRKAKVQALGSGPFPPTPQEAGSAISYARRYALLSILGFGQADDDGAQASGQKQQPTAGSTVQPKPHSLPAWQRGPNNQWHVLLPAGGKQSPGDTVSVPSAKTGKTRDCTLVKRIRTSGGVQEWLVDIHKVKE